MQSDKAEIAGDLHAEDTHRRRRPTALRYLSPTRLSGIYTLALLIAIFGVWTPATFLTATTARTVGANQAPTAILALALIPSLAAGAYDLSIAANMGVAAVLSLWLQTQNWNIGLIIIIVVLSGAVTGAINAFLVVRLGLSSFIATLAMSSVLAAVAYWITGGNELVVGSQSRILAFGDGSVLGFPDPVLIAIAIALVLFYVTEMTAIGRYLYATGDNSEASRLAGVQVNKVVSGSLVSSGALASVAGIVLAAQFGAGAPDTGPPYLLPAFSAVLLGATQIKTNGRVNVFGTLVAVVLLATGIYGLQLVGAPSFIGDLFNGVALVLAVTLALRASRRKSRFRVPR